MSDPPTPPDENTGPAGDAATPESATEPDYTGLLLRAGYNYHVFLASMFGFAREHGGSIDEFITWTARHVAGSWSGLRGHGADAVLRVVLENLASTGYPVEQVDLGATLSRATVGVVPLGLDAAGWTELLAPFDVRPEEMARLFQVFVSLVEEAGATLEVEQYAGTVRLTVRREPERPGPQPIRFFESP